VSLVQATTTAAYDLSSLGALIWEAETELALCFVEFHIMYRPRECNNLAHILAGLGASRNYGFYQVWLDKVPDFVNPTKLNSEI
jgi:hypothetical protein